MHELEQTFLLERLLPQLDANPDDTRRTCSSFRTDKVGSFRAFFGRHGTRRTPNSKCVMSRKAVRVRSSALFFYLRIPQKAKSADTIEGADEDHSKKPW
jgi:hypothetical protein